MRAAKDEVRNWIVWYNQERMHSPLGYRRPAEHERAWRLGQLEAAA